MKYIFLLNQFSLKTETNNIKSAIEKVCKKKKLNYKIEINSITVTTESILKKYKKTRNIIIAVGGDGTINRVLNSIAGTKNVLGYIPFGTGNDFYRTNKELLNKGLNKVDLVKINDKYFINIACFGIDADIGNNGDIIHSKYLPKKYRYKLGLMINFLRYKARNFEVLVNNKCINEYFTTIAVCNARYYGGGYKVSPNSSLDDGILEVVLAYKTNKYNMAKMISSMKDALHLYSPKIKVLQTDKVIIKSPKLVACNIDGEEMTAKEFNISIINKGIEVYYDQELIDLILKNIRK